MHCMSSPNFLYSKNIGDPGLDPFLRDYMENLDCKSSNLKEAMLFNEA